jgi:hypothetical protein
MSFLSSSKAEALKPASTSHQSGSQQKIGRAQKTSAPSLKTKPAITTKKVDALEFLVAAGIASKDGKLHKKLR